MNRFTKRVIGNFLVGFATGFLATSVTGDTAGSIHTLEAGLIVGLLQGALACGHEFKTSGETSGTKKKGAIYLPF